MNILFLTQLLPYPLVGGAKIRAYYMLRQLTEQHRVTLVSFVRADDRPEDVAHLRQFCAAVHTVPLRRSRRQDAQAFLKACVTGRPAVIERDYAAAMAGLLRWLASQGEFQVIHADQTAMAQYALRLRQWLARGTGSPPPLLVLDEHNALFRVVRRQAEHESGWARRWLWRWEAKRLAGYEADLCRRFDHILTVTAVDQAALLALLPPPAAAACRSHFMTLPICVDPEVQSVLPRRDQTPQIVHLGTMFWPPNVEGVLWFAREILPRIIPQVPGVRLVIAGKNPPPVIHDLSAPGSPLADYVRVTGFVSDPAGLLSQSRVFIVPLKAGGGMRVKILDAWQWGLPVVSTTIGAEGIDVQPGENILLADDPADFAAAVVRVLRDDGLAQRLRQNGRRWVEQQYNWRRVYPRLAAIYA
ncbi:MAG: glycosyltransferase family 4 protein [Candidatus Promineifilaceae bacterium]